MSIFEHLLTLGSFILALGIGQIVTLLARIYERRREVVLSIEHGLWILVVFLGQIDFWLNSYLFNSVTRASVPAIAMVIVQPILLYLQSALVAPDVARHTDLRAYHAREGRSYIGVFLAAEMLMTVFMVRVALLNPTLDLMGFFPMQIFTIIVAVFALFVRRRWVQILAPSVCLMQKLGGFYFATIPLTG